MNVLRGGKPLKITFAHLNNCPGTYGGRDEVARATAASGAGMWRLAAAPRNECSDEETAATLNLDTHVFARTADLVYPHQWRGAESPNFFAVAIGLCGYEFIDSFGPDFNQKGGSSVTFCRGLRQSRPALWRLCPS